MSDSSSSCGGWFLALALLALAPPAAAYPLWGNQPLPSAFAPEDEEPTLIHVEIEAWERDDPPFESGPPDTHVVFRVLTVLRGDPELAGTTVRIHTGNYLWPRLLLADEVGTKGLLVLGPSTFLRALLPAHREEYRPVESREAALRLVVRDLMEGVFAEEDSRRRLELLGTVAPVLTAKEAKPLERFLDSDDPWIARVALATLVWTVRSPEFVARAEEDIAGFLDRVTRGEEIRVPESPVHATVSPVDWLFRAYWFLKRDPDASPGDKLVLRPLLRTVVRHLPYEPDGRWGARWRRGFWPLTEVGSREDLPLLDEEYRRRLPEGAETITARHWLLKGMARILEVEFPSLANEEFARREERLYRAIRAALEKEE